MGYINYKLGSIVLYQDQECIITRIISADTISIMETKTSIAHTLKITELITQKKEKERNLDSLDTNQLEEAERRLHIISPLIGVKAKKTLVTKICNENNVGRSTLLRWMKMYRKNKTLSSLAPMKHTGGKGKSRISNERNNVIIENIYKIYLSKDRKSINKVIRTIQMKCMEMNIKAPSESTIRNRIKGLSEEDILKARYGKKKSDQKFENIKGKFPGGNFPLEDVQLDHTQLDIELVDEIERKNIGRPYLTIAIDVYSRMIIGYYLSFQKPGEIETGMCISNAILSKEKILAEFGIEASWPCWGVMRNLHLDNALEFRGTMLQKAATNYNIILTHRPAMTPHYSGTVERWFRTLNTVIHDLDGTTFSNIFEKDNYDSKGKACLTLKEFEKWLLIYITNIYHNKIHSSLGTSPLKKYNQSIIDFKEIIPKLSNERMVRLDFMPYCERTVQQTGVVINHIYYYNDILRKYINATENSLPNSKKKKFLFRVNPRDISMIYFYDEELDNYYDIPYRNTGHPPIDRFQYTKATNELISHDIPINENNIFEAYKQMEEIEARAKEKTKNAKKKKGKAPRPDFKSSIENMSTTDKKVVLNINYIEILPFNDIDYGKFESRTK